VRRLRFHRARTLEEALELRVRYGKESALIAGGTDLLVALREQSGSLPPVEVIDLTPVAALKEVVEEDGCVRLGPLVTHDQIERSGELRRLAPLLADSSATIGSPQIRNRGTIGGNICNAASCADTLPPLIALGARLTLERASGRREVKVEDFVLAPYRTVLEPDEILTGISFPVLGHGESSAFLKLGRRNALSISRMSVAVILARGEDRVLRQVRVAAGSVLPTVRRFTEAEECLEGSAGDGAALEASGRALAEAMVGVTGRRWSTPYKEPVIQVLVRRAVVQAMEA
jgi:CO/xanthine dehydrogenase FAD-binding subunit